MLALVILNASLALGAQTSDWQFVAQKPRIVEIYVSSFKEESEKVSETRRRLSMRLESSAAKTNVTYFREYLVTSADVKDIPTESIERIFNRQGSLVSEVTCLYREKMKSVGLRLTLDGVQAYCGTTLARHFDAGGRVLEETTFSSSKRIKTKRIYSYDNSSRLQEIREYDSEGALQTITQFSFASARDAASNGGEGERENREELTDALQVQNAYDVIHTSIELDDKGRTIRQHVREGDSVSTTEWVYFAQGVTETISNDVSGERQRLVRNLAGDIVIRSPVDANVPNAELEEETIEYDRRGLAITRRVVGIEDGEIRRQERRSYKFDKFGNWISQRTEVLKHRFGKNEWTPVQVIYRNITY